MCVTPTNIKTFTPFFISRIDSVDALDLDMISAKGGNACILAERFLPEIAYKIGYAPKYGA